MGRMFLLGLCCLLSVCGRAQEHLYFRLVVEDSGRAYPVRAEDVSLIDSGKITSPNYSKAYNCLESPIANSSFIVTIRFQARRTLVLPASVTQNIWRIWGRQLNLKLSPAAGDSVWAAYHISECVSLLSPPYVRHPDGNIRLRDSTNIVNIVESVRFMYRMTWVDEEGQSVFFAEGGKNPEFHRLLNQRDRSRAWPNPNSTDIFLGPKPSEYYNLWPGN